MDGRVFLSGVLSGLASTAGLRRREKPNRNHRGGWLPIRLREGGRVDWRIKEEEEKGQRGNTAQQIE